MVNNQQPRILPVDPIVAAAAAEMGGDVNPSPLDLHRFYRLEHEFYQKLVRQLGQDPDRMKWVMALWIWFESIGHHDFIKGVSDCTVEEKVFGLIDEAIVCLEHLVGRGNPSRESELPLTRSLMTDPLDLGFLIFNRSSAASKVAHYYRKVATVLFDDRVVEEVARDADRPGRRLSALLFGEGTSQQGARSAAVEGPAMPVVERSVAPSLGAAAAPVVQSRLNPMAEPWSPETNHSPEDQRSMFITFSRGYPLTRDEITEFFNS